MEGPTFSNTTEVIYLLGAAQGLFLAAVLASRSRNALPNRLLAAVVLVFSVDLAMAVYHASGFSTTHPALIGLDLPVAFLYGPLLYLYVRTLTADRPGLTRADAAHVLPFVAAVLFLMPFFLRPGPEKLALMQDPSLSVQTRALAVLSPLKLLHGFAYLGLVAVAVRRHRRRLQDTRSSVEHMTLAWVQNLMLGVIALLILSAVFYVLGDQTSVVGLDPSGPYDDLTLLGVTVFVYALGYFGLRQPEIAVPPVPDGEPPSRPDGAAYARSGMSADDAARHRDRLLAVMDTDHLYRRGDLKLQDLAEALGLSSHNLTEVINTQLGQSFYDFVNAYRVREVQARLTDPAYAHLTVLALGMDAGFNAKSSFNAAFKRHTGMTPSQYRKQHTATT